MLRHLDLEAGGGELVPSRLLLQADDIGDGHASDRWRPLA